MPLTRPCRPVLFFHKEFTMVEEYSERQQRLACLDFAVSMHKYNDAPMDAVSVIATAAELEKFVVGKATKPNG